MLGQFVYQDSNSFMDVRSIVSDTLTKFPARYRDGPSDGLSDLASAVRKDGNLVTSRNKLQATADAYNLIIYIFGANSTEDANIISNGGIGGGLGGLETIFVVHYGKEHYKAAYIIEGTSSRGATRNSL